MLVIDGRQYRLQLAEENGVRLALRQLPLDQPGDEPETLADQTTDPDLLTLNLPTALSIVGGQHPVVGQAQWRVQQAYAELDQARVLWLPTIQPGFNFHRHDGRFQASDGSVIDVNRNSLHFGLGAGSVGAGPVMRHGLMAQFHLADAIFQPQVAEKTAWARGHAASAALNRTLRDAALAYLDLLAAHQDYQILEETHDRTADLTTLTGDFATTGQGLQADADRMETELVLVESRLVAGRERVEVASARLVQALSITAGQEIVPLDPTVLPLAWVAPADETPALISTALATRPELKESQALVAAAIDEHRRQRYAPFVPSVLLGFSSGGFGGGLGTQMGDFGNRLDFDALMTWEVRNFGFGERAARRQASAQVQQAQYEKLRVLDEVAREVAEAHSRVRNRSRQIEITQRAIEVAENSYRRNVSRIRDGEGLPLEALQSVQALEQAQRAYLQAVVDHNQAQFQLQYALGWPVDGGEQFSAAVQPAGS